MKLSAVVINLTPINETSTLINPSIAMFIAETLKLPAIYKEEDIRAAIGAEVVIVVNGLGQFCKARGAIGDAIAKCKKFVWVMNDYRVQFPRPHSDGSSEILDGVRRGMKAGMEFSYWATVPKVLTTPSSRYVNWNAIAHRPERALATPPKSERKLIYYGALRPKREETFRRFLMTNVGEPQLPMVVAAPERQHQNWIDHGLAGQIELVTALPRPIEPELQRYAMGLYLQDDVPYYESPASRFYELLGAGVPIVFQPEAVNKLRGLLPKDPAVVLNDLPIIDVSPYICHGPEDYDKLLRKRTTILHEQQREWGRVNHREVLRDRVKKVWSELLRRTSKNTGGCHQAVPARSSLISGG
jgi:hypothetical protein